MEIRELDGFVYELIEELEGHLDADVQEMNEGPKQDVELENLSNKIEELKTRYEQIKWGDDY